MFHALLLAMTFNATDNASAGNQFVSTAQANGLQVAHLSETAAMQMAVAYLLEQGSADEVVDWAAVTGKPATFAPAPHTHPEYDGLEPHTHPIADVTDLQSQLDAKADDPHAHTIADTVGLQASLDAKAAASHGHPQSDVVGLVAAIAGKSDVGHGHTIAATAGLQAALDGKAGTGHGHVIGDTTGLQAALDGKATAAQGAKADTALQNAAAFATAAQGTKADSAVQPAGLTKAAVGLANADNTADLAKPISTATQTALDGKSATSHNHDAAYAAIGHNHNATYLAINDASVTNARKPAYVAGDGGTATQATNKATGVTINKLCGEITMHNAALAAATIVSFTFTNSTIGATDTMQLNHVTTGTRGAYGLNAQCAAGSAVIYVRNNTAGSLGEAIVIRYAVIKGVTS